MAFHTKGDWARAALAGVALTVLGADGAAAFQMGVHPGGRITYTTLAPRNRRYQPLATTLGDARFSGLSDVIGRILILPRDLSVVATECGKADAYYDPAQHRVVLCYELAAFFGQMFDGKSNVDPRNRTLYVANAMTFTLLHELGHGIIGELDLGVTGGEEDAVDDFAALALLEMKQGGIAVDGAEAMLDLSALSRGQTSFADEHSFSQQRFYNVVCLVYGSDPVNLNAIVQRGFLPPARAQRCPEELRKKRKAWEAMTEPYTRH